MSSQKIVCDKCGQKSPRSMHNKCIYCGEVFEEEYHFSQNEKAERVIALEEDNIEQKKQLAEHRKKEAERGEARRKSASDTNFNSGLF